QNDTYTIVVTNAGGGATTGNWTVADTLPAGLTFSNLNAPGLSCTNTATSFTCTQNTVIQPAGSVTLTLFVNVAANAAPLVTNTVTVSGGGEANTTDDSASDPTTVIQVADLTIAKYHIGPFHAGDPADQFSITVMNVGPGPTVGTTTLTDTLPQG